AAALSPDGQTLAVAGYGFQEGDRYPSPVYLVSLQKENIQTLRGPAGPVTALCFSSDGQRLAAWGQDDPSPRVWNLDRDRTMLTLNHPSPYAGTTGGYSPHIALSPD